MSLYLYRKYQSSEWLKKKYLCSLFKTKENFYEKKYYFLGIQYSKKFLINRLMKKIEENTNIIQNRVEDNFYNSQVLSQVENYHKNVFPKYRYIHKREDIVIIGAGPSIQYFSPI